MADETRDNKDAIKRSSPSSKVVHRAILHEGFKELERPSSALFWSALAAGLSMSLSLITEALLQVHLPAAEWRPLITKFGYSIGFLVVILGRQQLYTENTLTAVLPVLEKRDRRTLAGLGRLWTVVLIGNLAGCVLAAFGLAFTGAFDPTTRAAFLEIGREAVNHTWGNALARGIVAGWIIALIVWVLPFAAAARFFVIVTLTYIVGLGSLTHIVAGSVEAFVVAASGQRGWLDVLFGYNLPTLLGNTIGGVTLVAALNHAQVVSGRNDAIDA